MSEDATCAGIYESKEKSQARKLYNFGLLWQQVSDSAVRDTDQQGQYIIQLWPERAF